MLFFRIILLLAGFSTSLFAQERIVLFTNMFSGKQTWLGAGDEVHLRFSVHEAGDSMYYYSISDITLHGTIDAVSERSLVISSKNKFFERVTVEVEVYSIEAFRKYSRWRPVMKAVLAVGTTAAGLLVSMHTARQEEIISWENTAVAVAAGLMAYAAKKTFSDRMKIDAVEGWRPQVITLIREKKKAAGT